MTQSIDEARQEVQSAVAAAVAWADSSERRPFVAFESTLWTLLLALGRALARLFLVQQAQRPRPVEYRREGRTYRLDDRRVSPLSTRFGKVLFARPVGRHVDNRRAAADLPVDRELGLCSGFSLGVVTGVTRLRPDGVRRGTSHVPGDL